VRFPSCALAADGSRYADTVRLSARSTLAAGSARVVARCSEGPHGLRAHPRWGRDLCPHRPDPCSRLVASSCRRVVCIHAAQHRRRTGRATPARERRPWRGALHSPRTYRSCGGVLGIAAAAPQGRTLGRQGSSAERTCTGRTAGTNPSRQHLTRVGSLNGSATLSPLALCRIHLCQTSPASQGARYAGPTLGKAVSAQPFAWPAQYTHDSALTEPVAVCGGRAARLRPVRRDSGAFTAAVVRSVAALCAQGVLACQLC
jgi:hypothetical protein